MAIQKNILITGRFGNILYYIRDGQYCNRTIPDKIRQTKGTKARSKEFGKASTIGKLVRQQLLPVIPFPQDRRMQISLVSNIFAWLSKSGTSLVDRKRNLSMLEQFQFTDASQQVSLRWKPEFSIMNSNEGLQIDIPAYNSKSTLHLPPYTKTIKYKLSAGSIDLQQMQAIGCSSAELSFEHDKERVPAQSISLAFPMKKGNLVFLAAGLEFITVKKGKLESNETKKFRPAEIISAFYV